MVELGLGCVIANGLLDGVDIAPQLQLTGVLTFFLVLQEKENLYFLVVSETH